MERRQKCERALKTAQSELAATEVINAIYYLLSRLVDDGGFTKDLSALLDQLPPSIRGEISEPLRKELEVMQMVAFAPGAAWKNLAKDSELRKHTDNTFQILEKMIRLAEEGSVVIAPA